MIPTSKKKSDKIPFVLAQMKVGFPLFAAFPFFPSLCILL
jgi:hypothetical protein